MKRFLFLLLITASLAASPQAVIFDFGGVLTGAPDRECIIHFVCDSLHLSRTEFEQANAEKKKTLQPGQADEDFWKDYAQRHGIVLPGDWDQQYKRVVKEAIRVNPEMFVLVDQLKQQPIIVGLLSNIDERFAKLLREFNLYDPFEPCLLSCELDIEKPDPKIYEILLAQLNVPAEDVIFIDDTLENVVEAKKMGLDAILFESVDQIRCELKNRGLLLEP